MFVFLLACTGPVEDQNTPPEPTGIAALGHESHDIEQLALDAQVRDDDGLSGPRDLAFNPEVPGELWVVSGDDDSATIVDNAGSDGSAEHIVDPYALHFMDNVSSIAFGAPGTFATCQESKNTYNGQGSPNNFMGPSLWSSDREVFGQSNPSAVEYLSNQFGQYVDLGSHLDMLHESPNCMGIAWSHDNVYWVFDGQHSSLNRYDFADDHGAGFDDHSDGVIGRYLSGEVSRVKDVPSHMELDRETGLLYVADTGNNRVLVLDTESGEQGAKLATQEAGVNHHEVDGADSWTLLDGEVEGWEKPSGLALHEGVLYVSDYATGTIYAYDVESGALIDWVETGRDKVTGIEVVSQEEIWFIDAKADRAYRLAAN